MNGRISRLARCYGFCGAGGEGGYQATGEGPRQRKAGQEQVPVYVRGMKWEGDREEEQTQREEGQRERSRERRQRDTEHSKGKETEERLHAFWVELQETSTSEELCKLWCAIGKKAFRLKGA